MLRDALTHPPHWLTRRRLQSLQLPDGCRLKARRIAADALALADRDAGGDGCKPIERVAKGLGAEIKEHDAAVAADGRIDAFAQHGGVDIMRRHPTPDAILGKLDGTRIQVYRTADHVSIRAADMCMNIYLGLGMSLAATVKGIQNKIEPGEPCSLNLYDMTDEEFETAGIRRLPRNLMIALDALRNDDLAEQVMGPVMLRSYLAYKDDEWERYHQTVTDWEVAEYLRLF